MPDETPDGEPLPPRLRYVHDCWLRNGRTAQRPFPWNKVSWTRYFGRHSDFIDGLPDEIGRGDARTAVEVAISAGRPVQAFLAAMVWGYGSTNYGPYRTHRLLDHNEDHEEALGQAAEAVRTSGALSAFTHLADRRLKYLGVAYATKYLYFCSDGTGETPLILDGRVRQWLWDHTRVWIRMDWNATAYQRYLSIIRQWANSLSQAGDSVAPDALEYLIFADTRAGGKDCKWGGAASDGGTQLSDEGELLQVLDQAADLFNALPAGQDPHAVGDYNHCIRQLRRIVLSRGRDDEH